MIQDGRHFLKNSVLLIFGCIDCFSESVINMTSILDLGEGGVDPHAEVKKLQELVKKLETQNEVLRRKQKVTNDTNLNGERQTLNNSVFYNTRKQNVQEKRDSTSSDTMDTIDLIDIEKSLSECEDSW